MEGSSAPRRPRDQEPPHSDLAQFRAHPPPYRTPQLFPLRAQSRIPFPGHHPALRRSHLIVRRDDEIVGRSVLCACRVSLLPPPPPRPQHHRRKLSRALRPPSPPQSRAHPPPYPPPPRVPQARPLQPHR